MTTIEYYYSAHSAFAYLGSRRLYEICGQHSITLVHKPINLSPVVEAQGSLPFRDRTQAHVDYFFGREIERWAEYRDVPVIKYRPTYHDADYSLASGMIAALGSSGPDLDAFAHAILEAHWRDDADLSDQATLIAIAQHCGLDGSALAEQGTGPEAQAKVASNSEDARGLSVFGSPTYVVDGDPFYGQDRLELIERAVQRPFGATCWVNPPVN
ncbi:2-hydroxychromene-2-carboxylate isomerase [Falsiruegeria mediterranea]|uniref:2-hydroxychromene-2-carboxylate isomerase n=1 Tax=Falsiruegeria mediterranea M17 TaxID=1200281 RepID=A0A2R8CFQ8_9RHOB|nr:2-hydroxychromene-2-carboxylate isomerase [Falsiruegeria mediterranea]SPJ31259.1 2-hydroxychromene-2-carboxylate isomerase [Falsiruegeria mediterranea M17]